MEYYKTLFGAVGDMDYYMNTWAGQGYTHVHTHMYMGDGLRFVVTMKKVC
jgi:hypothetical protein